MLSDVQGVEQHNDYIVEDNRIGYVYGDRVVFNLSKGYLTAYAYIKEVENQNISEEQLLKNIGLRISCGNFSYAEVPKMFNSILGISGTVETTSDAQKQIIYEDYNFKYETFIPSYFGKQKLFFSTIHDVHIVQKEDYHQKIREMINKNISGQSAKRAVLVFFAEKA